jgi:UDP-glucuronate decarboxylase
MLVKLNGEWRVTLRKKRILVTGGAGFIGSHLCEMLITQDYEVICVDNYFTGSISNIAGLLNHPHFKMVQHDVVNSLHFEVDEIYNLACPASPALCQSHPVYTTNTCVFGAINVLEVALKSKARVLQASTSEVYGDPLCHPQKESYSGNVNPVGLRSCYDEGKRCAETMFINYHLQHHVPIRIARIFNTYGPRMRPNDGRVVSTFIVQALKGDNITIFGDGQQTRSFCFVDDLVDGLIRMMENKSGFIGPVNLGNPCEVSMIELAEKILRLTGSKSKLIFLPLPHDDPRKRKPVVELAEEKLGWKPRVDLEEGLEISIEYYEQALRQAVSGRSV